MAYNPFATVEALRDHIDVTQAAQIKGFYSEWADELEDLAKYFDKKTTSSSYVSSRYYRELKKQVQTGGDLVAKQVQGLTTHNMFLISDAMVKSNIAWLAEFGFPKDGLNAAFSYVPTSVVNSLVTGQVYGKPGSWNLSSAIWSSNSKVQSEAYRIVAQGVAQNMPISEIAKSLSSYVNPEKKLLWTGPQGTKIYGKAVDYSAQRLARTLVQHTYQQSFVVMTKDNPFVEEYIWIANGSSACPLCAERDGKKYKKNELPLDHPNGMCVMDPVIDDKIVDKLANWVNSEDGTYPEIDEFAKNFGYMPSKKQTFVNSMPKMTLADVKSAYGDLATSKGLNTWYQKLPADVKTEVKLIKNASGKSWDEFYQTEIFKGGQEAWNAKFAAKATQKVFTQEVATNVEFFDKFASMAVNFHQKMDVKTLDDFYFGWKEKQAFSDVQKIIGKSEEQLIAMLKEADNLNDIASILKYNVEQLDYFIEHSLKNLPDDIAAWAKKYPNHVITSHYDTGIKWKNGIGGEAFYELESAKIANKLTYQKIADMFDDDLIIMMRDKKNIEQTIKQLEAASEKIKMVSDPNSDLVKVVSKNLWKFEKYDGYWSSGFIDTLDEVSKKEIEKVASKLFPDAYKPSVKLVDEYIKNAEKVFPEDVYKIVAKEKIAAEKAAEKAAKEAAEKAAKELAEKKAAKEAAKIKAYKDAGVYEDLKKAEKAVASADDDVAKFLAKYDGYTVDGIWNGSSKSITDYPLLKESIEKKRDYYTTKKIVNKSAENIELCNANLKKLDEFEKLGKEYEKFIEKQVAAKKLVADIKAPFKSGTFDADDYSDAMKAAAKDRVATKASADKFHRQYLDSIWDDLTDQEKYSIWQYTDGSGGLNRPLSGYSGSWSESNFKGIGNVSWDTESGGSIRSGFKKAAGTDTISYGDAIAGCTRAIEKSELPEAVYCVRGSSYDSLAGLIEGDLFSHAEAKKLVEGEFETLKKALVNEEFQWHSFMSTGITDGTGFSGSVKYEIYLPKGSKAMYVEPQSSYGKTSSGSIYKAGQSYSSVGGEAELLIQRGSTFRITGVEKNGYSMTIKMELVEQPTYFETGFEQTITDGMTSYVK